MENQSIWPAIIFITMLAARVVISVINHGQEKPHNKYDGLSAIFAVTVTVSLLYWGGFFNVLLNR